jgi:hypothetical protein
MDILNINALDYPLPLVRGLGKSLIHQTFFHSIKANLIDDMNYVVLCIKVCVAKDFLFEEDHWVVFFRSPTARSKS